MSSTCGRGPVAAADELASGMVAVERVWSYGYDEDDGVFRVLVDLEDGTTACVTIAPGQPITVQVVT